MTTAISTTQSTATNQNSELNDSATGFKRVEWKESERTRCEIWTRVMGYHRPVSAMNTGKKAEYRQRKVFTEKMNSKNIAA